MMATGQEFSFMFTQTAHFMHGLKNKRLGLDRRPTIRPRPAIKTK
jgi:hypothetical protein